MTDIVGGAIGYLRDVLNVPDFTPLSFRAGNWLFQPTANAARVLAKKGIKIDSSVFKGGRQRKYGLDYRKAVGNNYFWRFGDDVTIPDPTGLMFEIPIYTTIVPFWAMITSKRLDLQHKGASTAKTLGARLTRFADFLRPKQPLKFDFCRMTLNELVKMVEKVVKEDTRSPEQLKPMVAIGHTKDLVDFTTIDAFVSYLGKAEIKISTFQSIYSRPQLSAYCGQDRTPLDAQRVVLN